jgi:hypothetical protein
VQAGLCVVHANLAQLCPIQFNGSDSNLQLLLHLPDTSEKDWPWSVGSNVFSLLQADR